VLWSPAGDDGMHLLRLLSITSMQAHRDRRLPMGPLLRLA